MYRMGNSNSSNTTSSGNEPPLSQRSPVSPPAQTFSLPHSEKPSTMESYRLAAEKAEVKTVQKIQETALHIDRSTKKISESLKTMDNQVGEKTTKYKLDDCKESEDKLVAALSTSESALDEAREAYELCVQQNLRASASSMSA